MGKYWRGFRAFAIAFWIIEALLFFVCAVPYLIPLGETQAALSPDELVGEYGRFLDIDGISVYVEEQNPESALATIAFIHGFGGSTFSWRNNVPYFASHGYRVVSLDMKGFGPSSKDFASDYSHPAQAELLANVFDTLGVDQAYLVGHSMGTSVMLHFAHLYPEKVLGLISVDGAVSLDKGVINPFTLLGFPPFRRAGQVFLTRYATKDRIGRILESAYYRQEILTAEVKDGYYSRSVTGHWADSLLAMIRDMPKNTITFALEDLQFPTLILWGEHDTWVKRPDIDRWKEQIRSAEFHAVPGAGHMLMEENPELLNNMVLTFLQSHGD